ncbi:MAG: 5'-methylthioadenosine/S-adenosylhomocysteine nucleosidase [Spirochaetaceae bacterium]|nr:5'-methylthioadenosine/S-adenosylhomocysteine nucleosidase [Spirochaetaceae bacterium]
MRSIGVLFALEREARSTLDDPFFSWKAAAAGLWTSERLPIRLTISGIGKAFAGAGAARVSDGASLLLSLGTSGSLSGGTAVGGLVLAGEFVEYDMDMSALRYPPGLTPFCGMRDPLLRSAGEETLAAARESLAALGLAYAEGIVTSGDAFMDDPSRANFIRDRTNALAVDMESAAIAKVALYGGLGAKGAALEALAFRVLSDAADRHAPRAWCGDSEGLCGPLGAFLKEFAPRFCGD